MNPAMSIVEMSAFKFIPWWMVAINTWVKYCYRNLYLLVIPELCSLSGSRFLYTQAHMHVQNTHTQHILPSYIISCDVSNKMKN